jgi:hypothetical protein
MFYNSKWKSGFFTGLITGIVIYAMAKSPRGRKALGGLEMVSNAVKDEVGNMANRATDVLDKTAAIANNLSKQENAQVAGQVYTPGGSYTAGDAYAPGRV